MADIARLRMRSLRLLGRPFARPVDVVRWLIASQAQDLAGAAWSIGQRTRGATDDDVQRALDAGEILRTHVLRPTWHFVAPEDIRWLLALTGPRVQAGNAGRYRQLGLDAAMRRRATATLARALDGGALTRAEIGARLGASGERLGYLLMHAELEAVICSGPRRGKQQTYALLEQRAAPAPVRSRDEALAELGRRYLASRAPASPQDLAKWSGLTVADARVALGSAEPPPRAARAAGPRAHLLSIFDEYISSYRDRTAYAITRDDARRIAASGNAVLHVLALDGRIAGTWRRTLGARVELTVTPFRPLGRADRAAVADAAERFAAFLGRPVDLAFRGIARS